MGAPSFCRRNGCVCRNLPAWPDELHTADYLEYFRAGRALQRMWLTATREGLALHPLTFLPYAFARVSRGGGRGFAPATVRGLEDLRAAYAQLLHLSGTAGEALLFRVVRSPVPAPGSARRTIDGMLTLVSER